MSDSRAPSASPSQRRTLVQRALSTTLLWGLVIVGIVSGISYLWFVVVGLLSLLGVREYLRMLGPSLGQKVRWATILGSAVYLVALYAHLARGGSSVPGLLDAMLVIGLVLGSFLLQFNRPVAERQTLENVTNIVFSSLYAVFLFNFLIRILFLPGNEAAPLEDGRTTGHLYALFLLAITKCTDAGAFLVGSWLGRHKMAPHISPKKTWEGFAGAMLFAYLAAVGVYWPLQDELALLSWGHVALLAPMLGIAAVLGDLAESVVKRSLLVKDSGTTIPGIGGVLDLIDSICFTAPVIYVYLHFLADSGA